MPQRQCAVSPLSTLLWIETVSLFRHSHPPIVSLTFRVLTKISWHVYHVYSTFITPRSGCDTAVTLFKTSPQLETVIVVTPWRSVAELHAHKAWRYSLQRAACMGVRVYVCVWETEEGVLGYEVEGLLSASELEVFEGLLRSSASLPLFYFHPSLHSCHM